MSRAVRVVCLACALALWTALPVHAQGLPGPPVNVIAQASGNQLLMTWHAPVTNGAASGFRVIARTAPSAAPVAVLPIGDALSFTTSAPNGTYYLSVAATNTTGVGPESTQVAVSFPGTAAAPNPPVGLNVTTAGDTATFTWTAPAQGGAPAGYVLFARSTPGGAPIASVPVTHRLSGSVIAGIPPGQFYLYVVAQNAAGVSLPTNQVTVFVAAPSAPGAPTLTATALGNTLNLAWSPGSGGAPTSYRLTAASSPGGAPIATAPLTGTSASFAGVPNGTYYLRLTASNAVGTSAPSNEVVVSLPASSQPLTQRGADITDPTGGFGARIALSNDGTRMVVGATGATNGFARVFQWTGAAWTQLGQDLVGEAAGDRFGASVDINAVGNRVAVGGYLNDGNGNNSGHVRVFDLVNGSWVQVGADINGIPGAGSGREIALSATGSRLVVAAPYPNSQNGDLRVYDLVGTTWTQVGTTLTGNLGYPDAVDISGDGNVVAASSPSAQGAGLRGFVTIYRLAAGAWTVVSTQAGERDGESFGDTLALNHDGSRIVVSASAWDNPAGSNFNYGQVRVFNLVGSTWAQVGASITGVDRESLGGMGVAISDDGRRIAATASSYDQVKVFTLTNNAWVQTGPSIRSTPGVNSGRPEGVALSRDGNVVAAGFVNGTPRRVRVYTIAP